MKMKQKSNIIAIIPARGGSKGLPGKNILPLHGKPLIAWSIEAALAVDEISHVIVTTDDEEIAQVSRDYGTEVPFMRPSELATDTASGVDVVVHALKASQAHYEEEFDWVLLLQPTSPLRTSEDTRMAIQMTKVGDVDAVIGLREISDPPQWMKSMGRDEKITDYLVGLVKTSNRQELDNPYIINRQFI
jgi:CMP-N-acetylneuraminic acid synthetase